MKNVSEMRWGVERRIEFIEFLLYWEGKINRKDITHFFGVSTPQASMDLRRYQEIAADNIEYDRSKKYYFAPKKFKPKLITPSAEQYLAQLLANPDNPDSLFYGQLPDFAVTAHFQRSIDANILRQVLQIINQQQAIEVKYQSLTRPNPNWRWIAPHALGFGAKRWHCRCYCEEHHDFRDFALSRILEIRNQKNKVINSEEDLAWHTIIDIEIGTNPSFSQDQQKVIEKDYGMINGRILLPSKVALIHYFLHENKLTSEKITEKQQIILINRAEIIKMQEKTRSNH